MARKDVMLAKPVNMNIVRKWPFIITQPKINGFHCRIKAVDGQVTLYTSEANIFRSVPHINAEVMQLIKRGTWPGDFELDGELYCHQMPLNEIQSRVKRTKSLHPDYKSIQYSCFDRMDEDGWNQIYRLDKQREMVKDIDSNLIQYVEPRVAVDADGLQDLLQNYMDQSYEGIIMRNPDGYYDRKKTSFIFKFKPTAIDKYPIIGVKEAVFQDTGLPKNELGSFLCHKDGATFSVGTGPALKAWDRITYWAMRSEFINNPGKYVAVVKYPEFTGARKVPFHPVVVKVEEAY